MSCAGGCSSCSCGLGILTPGIVAIRPPNGGTTPVALPLRPGVTAPVSSRPVLAPRPPIQPVPRPPAPGVPLPPPAAAAPSSVSSAPALSVSDVLAMFAAQQQAGLSSASGSGTPAAPFPASAPGAVFPDEASVSSSSSSSAAPWLLYLAIGLGIYAAARPARR